VLEKVFASLHDGVIASDATGAVVLANAAATRLLAMDVCDVPPDRWCEVAGLHDAQGVPCTPGESPLHRALRGEPLAGVEMWVRPAGSGRRVLAVDSAPLAGGGALVIVRDASTHHDARMFLGAVVENIPDMIFVKDAAELRFVLFNRAGEDLLGYPRDQLLGKNDYDFFTREEADFFTSKDRAVLGGGGLLDIPEEPIHTRLRGVRTLHTKKIPILDADGTPRYLLGISEDITERKREREALASLEARQAREQAAREAAEEGVRVRDEFLSIASHELRTPVTSLQFAIQAVLRLARKGTLADHPAQVVQEMLETAERQSRRLTRHIDTLLDVSRINAGRLDLTRARVDLCDVAREVVGQVDAEARRAGCVIALRADAPVVGLWDGPRLEQVVTNLVDNAVRYGAGKPIDVRVERLGASARLTVADHGVGIELDRQERIFDRFERAASAGHYGGLGLGLYIVRRILEALGGTIRVESRPGAGSTFVVDLPIDG
jgi:PAS domain S-box-containing protein